MKLLVVGGGVEERCFWVRRVAVSGVVSLEGVGGADWWEGVVEGLLLWREVGRVRIERIECSVLHR